MTAFVPLDDPRAIEAAEAVLRGDEPILLPTDTVYGLAALNSSDAAISRIYELKDRPSSVPIAVLVASVRQAETLARLSPAAEQLAVEFWPGPLTVVLPGRDDAGTVGVRCPAHPFVRALAERVGPLAVTSANRHGVPTPAAAADAAAALIGDVALVIDGGRCHGTPSTVVDLTGPELAIIRVGPISEERVRATALR